MSIAIQLKLELFRKGLRLHNHVMRVKPLHMVAVATLRHANDFVCSYGVDVTWWWSDIYIYIHSLPHYTYTYCHGFTRHRHVISYGIAIWFSNHRYCTYMGSLGIAMWSIVCTHANSGHRMHTLAAFGAQKPGACGAQPQMIILAHSTPLLITTAFATVIMTRATPVNPIRKTHSWD